MKRRAIIIGLIIVTVLAAAGYVWVRVWPDVREIADSAGLFERASGPSVTFAVVGDNHGVNEIYRSILKDIQAENISTVVNVADTSEHGTAEEFRAVRELEVEHGLKVIHVVGNHDIKADPSRALFEKEFRQPVCSAFEIGHARLMILDNADRKVGFTDECLAWFEHEIATADDRVRLLAYHRPFDLPLGDVLGDDETANARRSNQRFIDLLEKYGHIGYIFSGHIHTYIPYQFHGIPAVVTGGGGDPAQGVLGGSRANFFHYLKVTIKGKNVRVDLRRIQLQA